MKYEKKNFIISALIISASIKIAFSVNIDFDFMRKAFSHKERLAILIG